MPNIQNAAPSPLEQLISSRALAEGQTIIGGYDVSQPLPVEAFSNLHKGTVQAEFSRLGYKVTQDSTGRYGFDKPVNLEDLVRGNFNWKYFSKAFAQSVTDVGIRHGDTLSLPMYEKLTIGSLPAYQSLRDELSKRAFGLLGLSDLGVAGGPTDTVGRAGLENLTQDIRGAYAARGLNRAGQSAFFEGTQGISFLEGLRQSRQQEAFGTLGGLYPELAPAFGLGLQNQQYQRNTFWDLFNVQQKQADLARAALSNTNLFERNFYSALGGSLGGIPSSVIGAAGYATGSYLGGAQTPQTGMLQPYGQNPYA